MTDNTQELYVILDDTWLAGHDYAIEKEGLAELEGEESDE